MAGHVSTRHPRSAVLGLFGACCQPGRLFFFLIGLSALGESSLKSSPKGRWPSGQMPWPARQGAKGAAPSPARDRLLSRRTVAREEVPAQATTTQGFPASSLFSHQGFLNPWRAESLFPTLEEGPRHCLGWMRISALPYPFCGPQGTGH